MRFSIYFCSSIFILATGSSRLFYVCVSTPMKSCYYRTIFCPYSSRCQTYQNHYSGNHLQVKFYKNFSIKVTCLEKCWSKFWSAFIFFVEEKLFCLKVSNFQSKSCFRDVQVRRDALSKGWKLSEFWRFADKFALVGKTRTILPLLANVSTLQ